ncbi:MAG: hypothetical protein RLZ98_1432 [Pseudomonadota bacterium]|jgi:hypothetical protein
MLAAAGVSLALPATEAAAQSVAIERNGTVARADTLKRYDEAKVDGSELRVPYRPEGMTVGNFLMFPEASVTTMFDDNLYGTADSKVSDFRTDVDGVLRLQSRLPRHMLNVGVGGRMARYFWNSELDHDDVFGRVQSALHIDHAHTLSFNMHASRQHEETTGPRVPASAIGKTPISSHMASVALERDAGRLHGAIGAAVQHWDFQNVQALDGSIIDFDRRDLTVATGQLSLGYRFSPGYELTGDFRLLRYLTAENSTKTGDLDATGFDVRVGVAAETGPLLRWKFTGGYARRAYDRQDLESTNSVLAKAEITWLPTQSTRFYFGAEHGIVDTPVLTFDPTLTDQPGLVDSSIEGALAREARDTSLLTFSTLKSRVEFDVLHNTVFSAGAYWLRTDADFDGPRDTYLGTLQLDYFHTKNFSVGLRYEHQQRHTADEDTMYRNRVWATLKFRY